MDELLTVKTSDFEAELVVAKSYLEDNGIECMINSIYPTLTMIGGGVKLEVREEDYERAVDLLIKGGFATREDYEPSPE